MITAMTRTEWTEPPRPDFDDITVLICQNKTPDLIRLCLESLFNYYPTIKTLIVNGSPNDESGKWLKYKEAITPNLSVWDRVGYDSHGVAMDDAIRQKITTKYVMIFDSDVIIMRGGMIEEMGFIMKTATYLATGALMEVTESGYGIGAPKNKNDILRYIHPQVMFLNRDMYLKLNPFVDHGAPCIYTMIDAKRKGIEVLEYDVSNYTLHLSGASWCNPQPIWSWDNNIQLRPMVTFITEPGHHFNIIGNDYNVVHLHDEIEGDYVIHYHEPRHIKSRLFPIRFRVNGDYVCLIKKSLSFDILTKLRKFITNNPEQQYFNIDGNIYYSRKRFQSDIAL